MNMDLAKYAELTKKFECSYDTFRATLLDDNKCRLLHGAIGLATEAGELLEQVKKHVFYGKPLDIINVIEEDGDACWYIARIREAVGVVCAELEILERNYLKLEARYGGKFTPNKAINRDTVAERKALGQC